MTTLIASLLPVEPPLTHEEMVAIGQALEALGFVRINGPALTSSDDEPCEEYCTKCGTYHSYSEAECEDRQAQWLAGQFDAEEQDGFDAYMLEKAQRDGLVV